LRGEKEEGEERIQITSCSHINGSKTAREQTQDLPKARGTFHSNMQRFKSSSYTKTTRKGRGKEEERGAAALARKLLSK
jgi:hypothetical protein